MFLVSHLLHGALKDRLAFPPNKNDSNAFFSLGKTLLLLHFTKVSILTSKGWLERKT
jgi:hypothetical protein